MEGLIALTTDVSACGDRFFGSPRFLLYWVVDQRANRAAKTKRCQSAGVAVAVAAHVLLLLFGLDREEP